MKNILIVNNAAIGGGVENVMLNLAAYLCKNNKVTIFTMFNEYDFYDVYPSEIKYVHLSVPNKRRFAKEYSKIKHPGFITKYEMKIAKLKLLSKKYDVVIAIKEGDTLEFAKNLRAEHKYGWVHVDYNYMYWTKYIFRTAENEVNTMKNYYENIVCVSNATKDSVINVIGDSGNMCVKYNPINYKDILEKSKEPIELQKPQNKTLLVSSGRFSDQKNFKGLAKVCIELSKKYAFELWIVGYGDQKDEIQQMINNEQCDCIKLLGFKENPYNIMKMADWFVSSAVWETFGLAIQEALVLGVPVLTTSCPAIDEVFDSRFGMLVDNNENALKEGLMKILENNEIAAEYRKNISDYLKYEDMWEERLKAISNMWEK